ncbi:MAG: DUF4263 domain-containing protein [Bacteroidetes bacterium]|nr:DUF4263 domain-containing protein [Bacteroidota bacterium]
MTKWDYVKVEKELAAAYSNNSEVELLKILKENSFLFYELYSRKGGIQPVFHEISFGGTYRCDFAWLNDNSNGPEWVLVEVERPQMKLFIQSDKPSKELNGALEQVKSWDRYFHENPLEKKRIFGAVSKFRFIIVAGDGETWSEEKAMKWRSFHNSTSNIEIRSSDAFVRPLKILKENPEELWSFAEHPVTLPSTKLEEYWRAYGYMDDMRKIF